jgi:Uma2 family endonuclease
VIAWLEAGAQMVVVINPRRRTVSVYRSLTDIAILTEQDTLHGADVVPGWQLPLRDIFA